MKQKTKEAFPITKKDIKPTILSFVASGALQNREPKRHEKWAISRLGKIARESFVAEKIEPKKVEAIGKIYKRTAYWHGTGRYQRHGAKQVDVLEAILNSKAVNPALDPFDPKLGLTKTTSLSLPRLYARAYADMHSDKPDKLNRYVKAQDAANFYIVRPAMRHVLSELRDASKHPEGLRVGIREKRSAAHDQQSAMPQSWKAKTTTKPVSTMMAFGVGSDIEGNYPILFGVNSGVKPIDISTAITETREVRVADPIGLDHITHIEVPREKINEVTQMFQERDLSIPILAIEDVEQYVYSQTIGSVLLSSSV